MVTSWQEHICSQNIPPPVHRIYSHPCSDNGNNHRSTEITIGIGLPSAIQTQHHSGSLLYVQNTHSSITFYVDSGNFERFVLSGHEFQDMQRQLSVLDLECQHTHQRYIEDKQMAVMYMQSTHSSKTFYIDSAKCKWFQVNSHVFQDLYPHYLLSVLDLEC